MVAVPAQFELFIARHGETSDNAQGLILGHRDPPLSAHGVEQARHLAGEAIQAGVVAVWCSPLLRARQTAVVVGEAVGSEPAVIDQLIESARGGWEGKRVAEIATAFPDLHREFESADPDFAFPGGESLREQMNRTRIALSRVATGPAPALVVAHAGTIRAALLLLGRPAPPERSLPHGEAIPLPWPAVETAAG